MNAPADRRSTRAPRAVWVVIVALAAVAAGAAVATSGGGIDADPRIAAPLLGLMTLGAAMILRFRYSGQAVALEPFEAIMVPALIALPGPTVVLLTAIAHTLANVYRRNDPTKTVYNIVQWSAVAGIAAVVVQATGATADPSLRSIAGVAAAVGMAAAFNTAALALVMRIVEREPFIEALARIAPTVLGGAAINAGFGLLLVLAFDAHAVALAFFIVPLALLHWSHRGYATALADQMRLGRMHEAVRALAIPIDPREALPAFLAQVRTCFSARAAELVIVTEGGRLVHRVDEHGHASRIEMEGTASLAHLVLRRSAGVEGTTEGRELQALLEREGWRDCVSAPLVDEGRLVGALAVFDRTGPEGWEDGEAAVLLALAREAAAALSKGALLSEIIEEREKFGTVVARTSDGIFVLDAAGTIRLWNPALERITGFTQQQMLGIRGFELLAPHTETGARASLERWRTERDLPETIQVTTRTGAQRLLSCSYSHSRDTAEGADVLIVVARDVTEARETERLKDDFIATVSHELRTPLTPIVGWAETLIAHGARMDDAQRDEALHSIRRQAEHLERLIANLLQVSKIESERIGAQPGVVDAAAVVERVIAEHRALEPTRRFEVRAEAGALATGDALLAGQVVANLLSNAIKYSPADEPIVVRIEGGMKEIAITVVDRGPGIPASEHERIFERFRRLGNHLQRESGGAGLGLYIARKLAAAQGGSLEVASEPGCGASFTFRLPAAAALVRFP